MVEEEASPKFSVKRGNISARPGQPLQFTEVEVAGGGNSEVDKLVLAIGETLWRHGEAARQLLATKFADQKELVPGHLQWPCDVFVLRCNDGVLVRYDTASGGKGILRCGEAEIGLAEAAPWFSENVIHFPKDPKSYDPGKDGPQLGFTITGPDGSREEIAKLRFLIYAKTELPARFPMPSPPSRPPSFAVVENNFDFELHGVLMPVNVATKAIGKDPQKFIAHSRIQLSVGWQRIEIYPLLGDEYWKPEFAPMWAELDLLGAIAQRNLITSNLKKLDGQSDARRKAAALLSEFEALLGGPEEPVHQFLKQNPVLLCPTELEVWSKLAFGKRVSDFVIREPNNDYLLVEIEAPIRDLFRKDGQQRHELTHAMDQIADWIQYIEDNKQKVEDELGLVGISTNPKSLVVIGRSAGLTDENRRKITTLEARQNKLRILTYDDLLATARQNFENVLGPLQIQGQNIELYFFQDAAASSEA